MKTHIVKPGEGLGSIALRYSTDINELRSANLISAPGPLLPGQSLFIPADMPRNSRSIEIAAFALSSQEGRAANQLTYLCPYCHGFDTVGDLLGPGFDLDTDEIRAQGCAPLLCLANYGDNGGFSPELAHLLFCDNTVKARLFDRLISTLKVNKYYGLQLCFNYLFPFDRDNYSSFVHELSGLVHREGFMLSVELTPPDSPALSSATDYGALGQCCDRFSLMFCRWGHIYSPPQPLAPLGYIRSALDQLCPLIPAGKLLLGISGCGFDWKLPWRHGDRASQLSNSLAVQLAMSQAHCIQHDRKAQAPYFDYTDAAERRHRVYFEDALSIDAKLSIVEEYSLAGISLYSWDRELRLGKALPEGLYSAEKLL